jgi:hypothetical protein
MKKGYAVQVVEGVSAERDPQAEDWKTIAVRESEEAAWERARVWLLSHRDNLGPPRYRVLDSTGRVLSLRDFIDRLIYAKLMHSLDR